MKTPIEELIVKLKDLRNSIPDSDAMYRGGVINSIRLAEGMIEWEKEFIDMQQKSEEDWVEDMLQ
jgi:hypothetical protein